MMSAKMRCCLIAGLLVTGFIVFRGPSVQADQQGKQESLAADEPVVLAVRTTAQWCKVCNCSKEAFADVINRHKIKPVLFVTLDRTDENTSRQARYLASALGIREAVSEDPSSVGEMFLFNAQTKELISSMTLVPEADAMVKAVRKALASSG